MFKEVKGVEDLCSDLVLRAENMSIILLEATNSDQTTKCARDFVSVQDAKVSQSHWQVSITDDAVLEHDTMGWAVHRLETVTSFVTAEQEHVFFVVLVVTTSLPQFEVVHVRGNNFMIASDSVLFSAQVHELVVNVGALWVPECAARRYIKVSKELLLLSNDAMVTLFCLFAEMNVFIHLLLSWERNGIDALQTVIRCLAEPVGSRVAHDLKALDELGRWDVRASAQINQIATLVSSHALAVLNLGADRLDLERISLEECQGLLFRQDKALELLVITANLLCHFLDNSVVFFVEHLRVLISQKTRHIKGITYIFASV